MGTAGSTRVDVVLGVIRQYSLCIFRACIANVSPTPYCTITGTFSALEGLFPLGHLPHAVRDIESCLTTCYFSRLKRIGTGLPN